MKTSLIVLACFLVVVLAAAACLWTPDRPLAALEAKYLVAPSDVRQVAGTRLHVRDSGPKTTPAVILLHGFGASLHTWEPWAAALSADHRVIRLDLPGSGLSPPDATGDYTDARSLQLVIALMDQLGVARASFIGHSMGGRIAWWVASHRPDRVEKLVLVAPDGFASPGFEYGKAPAVPAPLTLMRYALPEALLRMSLKPAYANPAVLTDDMSTRYHDLLLSPGARDAMLARMRQTVLTDPVPWLKKITAPTLLLWGEQDAMIPLANSADYLKAIPHAEIVALPGIGHIPHEEDPARALRAVQAFLK